MPSLPEPITALTSALARLPGIGPRSAERIALHLVQADAGEVKQLASMLVAARERIRLCSRCGALTESDVCDTCSDSRRDSAKPLLIRASSAGTGRCSPGTIPRPGHRKGREELRSVNS